MFLLDVRMALLCSLIVPALALWVVVYRKFATQYNIVLRARNSDINGLINESIQGMPIIRAFRRQKETTREFEQLNEEYYTYQNKMLNLNSLTGHNLVGVLKNLTFIALIWYFGGASLTGTTVISLGVLYAFIDYLNRLFNPVVGIVNQLANLEQSLVSAGRVFELMDEPGLDVSEERIPRYKGRVEFDAVSFAYREKEKVLKNISFKANPGETVALVGHTGSGKSSIMNCCSGSTTLSRGRSASTAPTSASGRSKGCASIWASSCRILSCSPGPWRAMFRWTILRLAGSG